MSKNFLLSFFLLLPVIISGSIFNPAKANYSRSDFGQGAAAFACFLLWEGYSKYEVENLISEFAYNIEESGFSEREMNQMAYGYRFQIQRTNNCNLRMRY